MKGQRADDPRTEPANSHPPGLVTTMRMAARPSSCLQRTPAAPFDLSYIQYMRLRPSGSNCRRLVVAPRICVSWVWGFRGAPKLVDLPRTTGVVGGHRCLHLANLSLIFAAVPGPEVMLAGRPALLVTVILIQIVITLWAIRWTANHRTGGDGAD